jgi:hypothetical protein
MTTNTRFTTLLLLLLIGVTTSVQTATDIAPSTANSYSLDWQRIELEKNIRQKIDDVMLPLLSHKEYLVDIEIVTNRPEKPKFIGGAGNKDGAKADGTVDGAAIEDDPKKKEEQKDLATKAKKPEEEKRVKPKIKPRDVTPDQLPTDYIVFSKLGLEAPLIDDFDNFKRETIIKEVVFRGKSPSGSDNSAAKNAKHLRSLNESQKQKIIRLNSKIDLMKRDQEGAHFEQLWKFQESRDLFRQIKNVAIVVSVDEKIVTASRTLIEEVLSNLNFNLGSINPNIMVKYMPFMIKKEHEAQDKLQQMNLNEILNWLAKFSNMIGLIIATFVLGALAYLLLKRYEEMDKSAAAAAAAESAKDSAGQESAASGGGSGGPSDGDTSGDFAGEHGLERFCNYFKRAPDEAILLVKKWINFAEDDEKNALRLIVQELDHEVLASLFERLEVEERARWKSFLSKAVPESQIPTYTRYISNQVIEDIILPQSIKDPELCDLLIKITPESASGLIEAYPNYAKILFNIVNTKIVARILNSIDDRQVTDLLNQSITFDINTVDQYVDGLKDKLLQFVENKCDSPFLEKILLLIPMLNPDRELTLYRTLAESEKVDEIADVAKNAYPADLIPNLPGELLTIIMREYPMNNRIELLESMSDTKTKEIFMAAFASPGSKARDIYEYEVETRRNDIEFQNLIRKESERLWKDFIDHARVIVKRERRFKAILEMHLEKWISALVRGQDTNLINFNELAS